MMKLYKNRLALRDYQQYVRKQLDAAEENSIICQPTGTGKTRIMVDYLMDQIDNGSTIAVIVPKQELILNIEDDVRKVSPQLIKHLYSPINSKMSYKPFKRLYVGTYGSFMSRYAKMRKKPDIFLHDEAHHCKASTWQDIVKLPGRHFGFTATPIRLDGRSLSDLFPGFIDTGKDERWFIDNNYLADYEIKSTLEVDFDKPRGFDNLGQQSKIFDKKELIGDCVLEWKKFALGKKTIVFTTGKSHNQHVYEAYTAAGISAVIIDSDMSFQARKAALDGFRTGKYLVLINVSIITEGVDVPDAVCCQLLRFTQSVSLYKQMVGRVLRPKPSGEKGIILDHAGNVGLHLAPDALIDWRSIYYGQIELDGSVKLGSKSVNCDVCNSVLYPKYSDQPYDLEYCRCVKCGFTNALKVRKQREMIATNDSQNLKDFRLSRSEQSILKIVSADIPKQKKQNSILKLLYIKKEYKKDVRRGLIALYDFHNNQKGIEQVDKMIEDFEAKKEVKKKVFLGDRR